MLEVWVEPSYFMTPRIYGSGIFTLFEFINTMIPGFGKILQLPLPIRMLAENCLG